MKDKPQKTFILGIGGQKCGTTWLYRYLQSFPNVDLGFRKEYHVWDRKYSYLDFSPIRLTEIRNLSDFKQYRMIKTPGYYERYFDDLITKGINITGDITPSYAGLSADHFAEISERIKGKGFDIKVVFLMRDPVQRCWSSARMTARTIKRQTKSIMPDAELSQHFNEVILQDGYIARTRYEETIKNLEQTFSPNELYFGTYETMHSAENLAKLSKFCGVPVNATFSEKVINRSPSRDLSPENAKACFKLFQSAYEYCHTRFPETKTHWQTY